MQDGQQSIKRPVPVEKEGGGFVIEMRPVNFSWKGLGEMLDDVKPKGLGLLMPLASQLHWYAYTEARARGIVVGLAQPSNITALTGLVDILPIDAVVATEAAAHAFAQDLDNFGILSRIRGWYIFCPQETSTFSPPSGKIFYGYDAAL